MTREECKQWFDYHAAAFPAFSRTYSSLRQASTDQARHGWNFIQSDLEDITYAEARDATDYMRAVNSQAKPEQHSREVARIVMTQRIKRRESSDSWSCDYCRDSGTALIFAGCSQYLLRKVHDTYWKVRVRDNGEIVPPDPRWKYFIYGIPCFCASSPGGNEWLSRYREGVVLAWSGLYRLTEEDHEKIDTGAELYRVSSGWQTQPMTLAHEQAMEF